MPPDVLRIFVSSPGDVGEERVMTERVVQRLQGWFGQSVKLHSIIWEHEPMRATLHPQEQLPLPSECDIVVCLLWSRLGTRLPDKISTVGKFEEAARSFREKGMPDLLVYRKTKEVLASVDDETTYEEKKSQWNALSGFLTHWFKSDDGTFKAVLKTFEALDQFEELLERDLRKLIQDRLKLTPLAEKTWHQAPFRGLEVFDYEHAPIFFGRTRAIGAIREALVQQAAHGCAFVLVFGMSGVGKSSIHRALAHLLDERLGRRVVPPGQVFSQPVPKEVIGEQAPVLEIFAGVGGRIEHAAELVELLQGVLASPGETPQRAQFQTARIAAVDVDGFGNHLDALACHRTSLLLPPLVEKNELQVVEIGRQDNHVVHVAFAQNPYKIIADLGCKRLRLGENNPKEMLRVFGQEFDFLDGAG